MRPIKWDRYEVLLYIIEYKQEHNGCSPSYRDIGEHFNFHPGSVSFILKQLERDGFISVGFKTPRTIEVDGGYWVAPRWYRQRFGGKEEADKHPHWEDVKELDDPDQGTPASTNSSQGGDK